MSEEKGIYEVEEKNFKEMLDSPEMEKLRQEIEASDEQYKKNAESFWDNLSYDDKLKAFFYVCSKIHKGDVEEQGSYRHVLYDVFNFDMDSYGIGMNCGYLNLHNYIYGGIEFSKFRSAEEVEFRSGDIIHRFPISKDDWVNVSFDEETNQLLITTEEKF
jgi:hypothetical protein